jgi:Mce-associated membrane protein
MPSTPSTPSIPPRRRSTGIRRPRVAGRGPAAARTEPPEPTQDDVRDRGSSVDTLAPLHEDARPATHRPPEGYDTAVDLTKRDASAEDDTVATETVATDAAGEPEADAARPSGKRLLGRRGGTRATAARTRRPIPTMALAVALVVLTAAAVFFGVANAALRGTPSAQNTTLVDIGATTQVNQQVDDALKTVYSYDFARLDQNEADARKVITGDFTAQYDQLFTQVRQIAPQQQAVVTATVANSAVQSIDGDSAVVVVFLDQQVTRVQPGNQPQQLASAGRLTVKAQLVDGTWKIAGAQAQ